LYQKYGVEAQVSVSFQSSTLGSLGSGPESDNYGDAYTPVDAKVSFPMTRLLRGFVEVRNLNSEPRRRYAGTSDRRVQHEIYSRDFYAGLDWRF